MAARRRKNTGVKISASKDGESENKAVKTKDVKNPEDETKKRNEIKAHYLPPVPLVLVVMLCSGFLWVSGFRDVFATGRVIAGGPDEAMLHFTKSTEFFDESRGWKSKRGGLSSVESVTTDENNMGGLFIRKICGTASLIAHSQKLMPLLFHPAGAQWKAGHFNPLLATSILANMSVAALYWTYTDDLVAAGAGIASGATVLILMFEAFVMLMYLISVRKGKSKGASIAPEPGKNPKSIVCRIITRTVCLISTAIVLIAGRDLFFPGQIMSFIPRDDIYLEWTGALVHSPPEDTHEADDHAMESALFVGDKFVSQLGALYLLIGCLYKFVTAFAVSYGHNQSGIIKCKMIWRVQALGDGLILFMFRIFAAASLSASLDFRWHLMCIGYEALILGLYAFW